MSTPERIHDERTLELLRELSKADQQAQWKLATFKHQSLPTGKYISNDRRSLEEIKSDLQARRDENTARWTEPGDEGVLAYANGRLDQAEADWVAAVDHQLAVGRELHAHEANYTGWQRFWLVTSSAGRVHASMNCHTCNKGRSDTTFALLPELSGQIVDLLVAALGPVLCSVCFPDAPVEWQDVDRVPMRIAQVLLDSGPEAFKDELAAYHAKRAAKLAKVSS
jgi:hypothetical protein